MKNKLRIARFLLIGVVIAGLAGCAFANPWNQSNEVEYGRSDRNTTQGYQQSSTNTLDNPAYPQPTVDYDETSYTIEEMLTMAIQDEYLARQEYETIIDEYGQIRPFTNIIQAEVNHIEMLEPLFTAYQLSLPDDNAIDFVVLPETLEETYEIGVQAEVNNIAMYERFLEEDLPDDVKDVFERLMNASYNHLEAFARQVEGEFGGKGRSNGRSS
ncbi:MAG: DUF2202 domain-containing protein [Erysipelotrichaceae bacterium]|nr:DUF2202 domain-containing protein [Erysipelotrichaceae bacterium]